MTASFASLRQHRLVTLAWACGLAIVLGLQCPPGNLAPVAEDQSVSTDFQIAVDITLTATDPDGAPSELTYTIVDPPGNGTLSEIDGAAVTYTPNSAFSGTDSFTFTASDGAAVSNEATVSITVGSPPTDAIVEDTTLPSLTVGLSKTLTVFNNAKITVTGDAVVNGTLTSSDGRLTLIVEGDTTINGTLIAHNDTATDLPASTAFSSQPSGINLVVGDGELSFGENAEIQTNGNVVVTDDADVLDKTPQELFDEVEDVGGDTLDTLVPLPAKDPAFASKTTDALKGAAYQLALPPVLIRGHWPPAGAPAPPGDAPVIIFRFFGSRALQFGDWTVNGPPAPAGDGDDQNSEPGDNANGSRGKNGMRLNIWNNGGPINVTGNVVLNLADGGDGGGAASVCASATGGDGGKSGNFRMTAAGGIDLTNGTLTINPGAAGNGGDATVTKGAAGADGCPGDAGNNATATGGNGGDNTKRIYSRGNVTGLANVTLGALTAGNGGNATATACDGGNGNECCDGGAGGAATATAGAGGDASLNLSGLPIASGAVLGGDGGEATATGGNGGDGGDCKFLDGGDGGAGGAATATGGAGGTATGPGGTGLGGDGGDATATGGDGGNGGDSGFATPGAGGAKGGAAATAGAAGTGDTAGVVGEAEDIDGTDGANGGQMVVQIFCFPLGFLVDGSGQFSPGTVEGPVFDEAGTTQLGTMSITIADLGGTEFLSSSNPVDHIGISAGPEGGQIDVEVVSLDLASAEPLVVGGLRIEPLYGQGLSQEQPMIVQALDAQGQVIGTEEFAELPDNSSAPTQAQTVDALFDVDASVSTFRIITPPNSFVTFIRLCLLDP